MFFKKTIAGIAALTTIAAMSGMTAFAADTDETTNEAGFKTGTLNTVVYSLDDVQTIDCRYYDALPSIPYIRITDYYKKWTAQELEVKNNNDGTFELKVPIGTTATIDVNKDTLHTDDYKYFSTPEDEATAKSSLSDIFIKDQPVHRVYSYDIDFGKYSIDIIADNDDIWFPVPTLCDFLYSDLKNPFYMDDVLYFGNDLMSDISAYKLGNTADHCVALAQKYAENARPQDLVDYNYNELCFSFDTTYGFPGRPYYTDLLKEKGLDGMLSEGNDVTRKIKELMLSSDIAEYSYGYELLNCYLWDGGHTQLGALTGKSDSVLQKMIEIDNELSTSLSFENYTPYMLDLMTKQAAGEAAKNARAEMLKGADYVEEVPSTEKIPGSIYCEKGDVAFFSFDSFGMDFDAWDKYYHDNGEMPVEVVSSFYKCLERADKNPDITKFVIDMGANGGGQVGVVTYLASLIADVDSYTSYNYKFDTYEEEKSIVDKNLDKVIDEKDKNFKTDLKFGVITSRTSFSCGNLLPSIAHDNGIMLMGEQSGGGACSIQIRLTADGNLCILSASDMCLIDKDKKSIDLGIKPDYENVKINAEDGSFDFSETYNFDNISKYFDEFYNMTPASSETTTAVTTASSTVSTTSTTAVTTASASDAASETKVTESTTVSSADTTAETTTVKADGKEFFAPVSKMGDMAIADYEAKNGTAPANSVTKDNRDGTYSIILSDDKGNVLDTYTIDPATGKGKDSKGNDIDLPQTGNNSLKTVAAASVAITFMSVGAAAVIGSGIIRKKKENE